MATFHLKSWRNWSARFRSRRIWQPSIAVATDWLLSVALCLGLAACLPASAAPVALAALLSLCGFVWLMVAIVQAGPPQFGRQLTAWDAALFSFAASFAVQAALRLGLLG